MPVRPVGLPTLATQYLNPSGVEANTPSFGPIGPVINNEPVGFPRFSSASDKLINGPV
jgi:hypothetical protein